MSSSTPPARRAARSACGLRKASRSTTRFAHGTDTELADKVLAGETYTELSGDRRDARRPHGPIEASMSGLAASPTSTPSASTTTSTRSPGEQKRGPGRHPDRLAILTESDVSRYLWQREPTRHNIDLLAAVRRRDVVLFRLDADRRPLLASMLAAAIVQDLLTIAAELQHQPVPTLVLKTSSPPSRPAASAAYSAVAAPLA